MNLGIKLIRFCWHSFISTSATAAGKEIYMKKVLADELYTLMDYATGEDIFYVDNIKTIPFNGIALDYFKGVLSWEFEVKDGYRTGIERTYYDETGELKEENETDHNTVNGLAKEYYKNGNIKCKSIVIHNAFIDSIRYDEEGNIITKKIMSENENICHIDKNEINEYREKYKSEMQVE